MVKSVNRQPIQKLPEYLFYLNRANYVMNPPIFNYRAISTKTGRLMGDISCHKSDIQLRPDYEGTSLAIDYLASYPMKKGVGTTMINFAKTLSKKWGCNGYILLKADNSIFPSAVPHLFYRKMGFTTLNKKTDKKIDKFIKKGVSATKKDFRTDLMFFPQPKQKLTLWDKLKNAILPNKHN